MSAARGRLAGLADAPARAPWFEARQRAAWVRNWWTNNKWLGVKGAVPEVRNLCDDVDALVEANEQAQAWLGVLLAHMRPEDFQAAKESVKKFGLVDSEGNRLPLSGAENSQSRSAGE